ncbi:MAG: hypothetical protein U5L06_11785 [Rhodovibrio sp.]|nr:hypothetical protein [Rhodovibrio sp.]
MAVEAWSQQAQGPNNAFRVLHPTDPVSPRKIAEQLRLRLRNAFERPLVMVVDGSLGHDADALRRIGAYDLLDALHNPPVRNNFHSVIISRNNPSETEATPFRPGVQISENGSPIFGSPASEQAIEPLPAHGSAFDLLMRMSNVDCAAEREIVRYFIKYQKNASEDLELLRQNNVIEELIQQGGYCLSDASRRLLSDGPVHSRPVNFDLSVNSGRILNFQPLEALRGIAFEQIEKFEEYGDYILDSMAGIFGTRLINDIEGVRKLVAEIRSQGDDLERRINAENLIRSQFLISYASQATLIDNSEFAAHLFRALEPITDAYAQALLNHTTDRSFAETGAARAYYNLGFVYDRMDEKPRSIIGFDRSQNNERVVNNFITVQNDNDVDSWSRRFHYGWYLFEAGHYHTAAEEMAHVAALCLSRALEDVDTALEIDALECAFLALAMDPTATLHDKVDGLVDRLLYSTGVFGNASELRKWLKGNSGIYGPLEPVPWETLSENKLAVIYFNKFDLFPAILVGTRLVRQCNIGVKYQPVDRPDNQGQALLDDTSLRPPENTRAAIKVFMGAPDSPPPIGPAISKLDPTLARLYQANISEDFSDPVLVRERGPKTVVMAGSGLSSPRKHWKNAVRKQIFVETKECTLMQESLDVELLNELFRVAKARSANLLFDGIVSKIRNTISRRGSNVDEVELENLRQNLKYVANNYDDDVGQEKLEEALGLTKLSAAACRATLDTLQGEQVSDLVIEMTEDVKDSGREPERWVELSEIFEILTRVQADRSTSVVQRQEFERLQQAFLGFRDSLQDLVRDYNAGGTFDRQQFNQIIGRFQRAASTFRQISSDGRE